MRLHLRPSLRNSVGMLAFTLLLASCGKVGQSTAPSVPTAVPDQLAAQPPPPACEGNLQALVDAAATGATLDVPPCVYREMVRITKPLTLDGHGQAEIRGSDVWSDWTHSGAYWLHGPLPSLPTDADPSHCQAGTDNRCLHAEQVFVDGTPLKWTAANPQPGQFAVDAARNVVLASDPSGHLVEVTTRQRWFDVQADHVTLQGLTMRDAASAPNVYSALSNQGYSSFTLQDSVLSDAHGSLVSLDGGSDGRVLRNDLSRAGQLGVSGWDASGALIQGNRIHDNGTDGFDWSWAAGGLKLVKHVRLTVDQNEVWRNNGPGLWCDIGCSDVTVSNNRLHDSPVNPIFFEISDGAAIYGNSIVDSDGWGAIVISSSANADVHDNVITRSPAIRVLRQDRGDAPATAGTNVNVYDNHAF